MPVLVPVLYRTVSKAYDGLRPFVTPDAVPLAIAASAKPPQDAQADGQADGAANGKQRGVHHATIRPFAAHYMVAACLAPATRAPLRSCGPHRNAWHAV